MSSGKSTESKILCNCSDGVDEMTPSTNINRPGLDKLRYRIGTHGSFLDAMKRRISSVKLGEGLDDYPPNPLLNQLTTRDASDASIALLDAWATVADVMSFYQERIANEAFLRTATERSSILELANLVNYKARPGVASTVYLAYTLDENQKDPVEIYSGSRVQSVPGPGESPQVFETSESLIAKAEWNNLQVQTTEAQRIELADDKQSIKSDIIYFKGVNTGLKTNDLLLFEFPKENESVQLLHYIKGVDADYTADRTKVVLQKPSNNEPEEKKAKSSVVGNEKQKLPLINQASSDVKAVSIKNLAEFKLLSKIINSSSPKPLESDKVSEIKPDFSLSFDNITSLLSTANAALADSVNQVWANAVYEIIGTPKIYAFRVKASPFGVSAPQKSIVKQNEAVSYAEWELKSSKQVKPDDFFNILDLDAQYDGIIPESLAVVIRGNRRKIISTISEIQTLSKTDYGITGKSTRLKLEIPWLDNMDLMLSDIRDTTIYAQSEELILSEIPCEPILPLKEISLQQYYPGLEAGRVIVVSGEIADARINVEEGYEVKVEGIHSVEIAIIKAVKQLYDTKARTVLVLKTSLTQSYKRKNMSLFANVVAATQGETRKEILGSGDSSKPLQIFDIKQFPLTYVPSVSTAGVDSTLKIYVNDLEWKEVDNLAGLGDRDRNFVSRTDNEGKTSVVFGNGKEGIRLPYGVENVTAVYRSGIGKSGNVKAGQINLLLTRPLGVKSVTNPCPASGGADKDSLDQIRLNAPLGVMALDRLVSVQDYADFSRTFAGIGKASAQKLSDGFGSIVHVTIAGLDDSPIANNSGLQSSLVNALRQFGDPDLPVQVDPHELVFLFLKAGIHLISGYLWESVESAVRTALYDSFGFNKRDLGQSVFRSEIIANIQGIPGVDYVVVDSFYGADWVSILNNLNIGKTEVNGVWIPSNETKVGASLAKHVNSIIYPAQLAVFDSVKPDRIILNHIVE